MDPPYTLQRKSTTTNDSFFWPDPPLSKADEDKSDREVINALVVAHSP